MNMNATTTTIGAQPSEAEIRNHTKLARSDAELRAEGYRPITICGETKGWTR